MDYSSILGEVATISGVCFPISLIFGLSAKLCNLALDMILDRKIEM